MVFGFLNQGADKAYMAAAHWDQLGYPLTRTAALREVEYLTSLMRMRGGIHEVLVKNWPRTNDLKAYAEQVILRNPHAAAHGHGRQDWMDDFVASQTREVRARLPKVCARAVLAVVACVHACLLSLPLVHVCVRLL